LWSSGFPDFWAVVVFWQSVFMAEVVAAVRTLEGHIDFNVTVVTVQARFHAVMVFS